MIKKNLLLSWVVIFLIACKSNLPKDVEEIYINRIDILQTFENVSIDQRNDLLALTFHCDSLSNMYVFEKSGEPLKFIRDTIQFDISKLHKSYLKKKNGIEEYLFYYLNKMDGYGIQLINSEFKTFGITLKLYLRGGELFYVADTTKIVIPNWIEYVKTSHKLDDYWYWKAYER